MFRTSLASKLIVRAARPGNAVLVKSCPKVTRASIRPSTGVARSSAKHGFQGVTFRNAWVQDSVRALHSSRSRSATVQFNLADIGEGITECEVIEWAIEPGRRIQQFEKICEVQSDKATVEITSRYDGVVTKLYYEAGQLAKVGKPLIDIETEDEVGGVDEAKKAQDAQAVSTDSEEPLHAAERDEGVGESNEQHVKNGKVLATPAVRRVAREEGVDLSKITGSGKQGRILKEDVFNFSEASSQGPQTSTAATARPAPSSGKPYSQPFTQIQKIMFREMTKSLEIPQFLYVDDFQTEKLAQVRATLNKALESRPYPTQNASNQEEAQGIASEQVKRMSYMPLLIKTFSTALTDFPLLNARVESATHLEFRPSHDVGVAIDTSSGLLVPPIRHVQALSIYDIALALQKLNYKGRQNAIGPSDLNPSPSITLSNIGSIGGGTVTSPVLLPYQVLIVAMGRIRQVPVLAQDGKTFEPKPMLTCSFSADHRVVDGATVARFAERWKALVQDPNELLALLR